MSFFLKHKFSSHWMVRIWWGIENQLSEVSSHKMNSIFSSRIPLPCWGTSQFSSETIPWDLTAFSPFIFEEPGSYGLVMDELLQHFPPTFSAPAPPPTTISANHVYKTSVSKSQFKRTHLSVQQQVASGVAPCEAPRPGLHMAGLQRRTGYDLFMMTMWVWCPVPACCGFTCLPQPGMTYLVTVSHFGYYISRLGKQRRVTGWGYCKHRHP